MAEKRGFIYKLMMGRDDQSDFDTSKLPATRWQVFKDLFRNRFGALVKINLLTVLFCLPAVAWMIYCLLTGILADSYVNYTGNLGFGMSATVDASLVGAMSKLNLTILQYGVLIPCLMIASIGFSGAFHTYKMLIWGEGVAVASTFFKGIKSNVVTFLWTTLILGGVILLVAFNAASYELRTSDALSILSIVASSLLLVIVLFMTVFMWTQAVTYKMKPWALVKNSFVFSIGMLLQNIFFVALSLVPAVLMFVLPTFFATLFVIFYLIVGFSYTFLIWTIYAHYGFDKYLNDRTPGAIKDRGIHRVSKEEAEKKRQEAAERRRKANNIRYVNPKKGKKPDQKQEPTITPLEETFSRKELERLAEEKKRLAESIAEDDPAANDDGTEE